MNRGYFKSSKGAVFSHRVTALAFVFAIALILIIPLVYAATSSYYSLGSGSNQGTTLTAGSYSNVEGTPDDSYAEFGAGAGQGDDVYANRTNITGTGSLKINEVFICMEYKVSAAWTNDYYNLRYSLDGGSNFGASASGNVVPISTTDIETCVNVTADRTWAWTDVDSADFQVDVLTKKSGGNDGETILVDALYLNVTTTLNNAPNLTSISASPDPIKGGSVITITAVGENDTDNDTIQLFCDTTTTPTSANTDCTGGTTSDSGPPYALNCTFTTPTDTATHTEYCRVYDGTGYSAVNNTTYTTDSTVPSTSVNNVAGDASSPYYDTVDDSFTNITVDGEASMVCRWSTSDVAYSSMSNDCTISSTQALCSPSATQGAPDYYVSCQDSLGNEQSTSENVDITALTVDWTAPTTSDNSNTNVQTPIYKVRITETDNVDADPTTVYCTDTTGTCTPGTAIDDNNQISYTSSERGVNYLRYFSTDDVGNVQATTNKTININQLPLLSSVSDSVGTIKAGSTVTITSNTSDADAGQTLNFYVCNTTAATSAGCTDSTYCSNVTANANASCSFTAESDDATHTWYAFLYDNLNEAATANPQSGSYTTDNTAPTITIDSPANASYAETDQTAQITLSESGDAALYSLDGAANVTMTNVSATLFTASLTSLANGGHTITFYANDTVGNVGVKNVSFTIDTSLGDTTAPTLTVWSPVNNTYYTTGAILLNITSNENLSWAGYSLNGSAYVNLSNATIKNWNLTLSLAESSYNLTFQANDTSTNKNTGNSSMLYFFVDLNAPANTTQGYLPASANDSANVTCYSQWSDAIALDYGVVEHNETGTPTNSSNISLSGTSGFVNLTIDSSNINPGSFDCTFYAFDQTGQTNSTTITVSVADVTNPVLENTTYAPNTTDDLDVNVAVNVTADVTDSGSISTVTLQWRNVNTSTWTEVAMTNNTAVNYNASFTPTTAGNYTFRINATDSANNENVTAATNITVEQDYTWLNSTTIQAVKSYTLVQRSSNTSLGNVTVNNTGDFDLNFTISTIASSSSLENRVTINGTSNTTITILVPYLTSDDTVTIEANTTDLIQGLYNYSLEINATNNGVLINSQTINNSINIQDQPGPYLSLSITTVDPTVTAGDTEVSYVATLSNFGTSESTSTWLSWTLPSDWNISTGTANRSIGTLAVSSTATNSITVNVGSSTGSKTIIATANCAESECVETTASQSVTVSAAIEAAGSGSETPATTGGGSAGTGGGGGGGGGSTRPELVSSYEFFDVVRGRDNTYPLDVKNIFKGSNFLEDVTIDIDGFFEQYITYTPQSVTGINFNETDTFFLTIAAPSYLDREEYDLNITIKGDIVYGNYSVINKFTERRTVTLIVHEYSQAEANESLQRAFNDIKVMQAAGFGSRKAEKSWDQANEAFLDGQYGVTKVLADQVHETKETAFETDALINEVLEGINTAEERLLEIPESKRLINLAIAAFEREDYNAALQRSKEARSTFIIETKGRVNIWWYIQAHWWQLLIAGLFTVSAGFFVYVRVMTSLVATRLKNLAKEEMATLRLLEETQEKFFKKKAMSPDEYYKTMYEHQTRLTTIKEAREKLRTRKIGIRPLTQRIQELSKEEDAILNLIKRAQKDHFQKGSLSSKAYGEKIHLYQTQLAEIEEHRVTLETKHAKDTKKAWWKS